LAECGLTDQGRAPAPPEVEAFARALLACGITFVGRNGRLWVQPAKAYQHLTTDEKAFIAAHRQELKTLAASKALPEATVEWKPTTTTPESQPPTTPDGPTTPEPTPARSTEPTCRFGCGTLTDCARLQTTSPSTWRALHWQDPVEIERRRREATAVMLHQIGKPSPLL
jgi:hypothetical protein